MAAVLVAHGMTLAELLGREAGRLGAMLITELVADHRDVVPGAAFVALSGARTHGLDFADAARAAGAAVVLYDPATSDRSDAGPSLGIVNLRDRLGALARAFYGPQVARTTLVGVTGTNGKTSVAYLIAQALTQLGRTCGYIGTLGFGIPPGLTAHRLTTPDCLTLHREIASLPVVDVALEVSSHALVQERAAGLELRHAVFTNLSHEHLDAHGSLQHYGSAKALLFTRPEAEYAVLNDDDPFAATLRATIASGVRVLGVTTRGAAGADLMGRARHRGLAGQDIAITGTYGSIEITSQLVGEFNTSNLLLALGALLNLDVPYADACRALAVGQAPPGRMEAFGGGAAPWVIVDYAHTPDALQRVIAALRPAASGAIWCVFGCGGERDPAKRPAMGRMAAAADHVVLTDDNPRHEDPEAIITAIRVGLRGHSSVRVERDRHAAIALAVAAARAGDVVLVAGRGAEPHQLVADRKIDFDDRAVVSAILGRRS